jgi:hypothetical protein
MNEEFSVFMEALGGPIDHRAVPPSSIERYRGKLPDLLLKYWDEHGWCGYGQGIFWMVNPQDYEGVVASWLEGTELEKLDTYHVIARSAFGDLYLWGEKTGASLDITSHLSRYLTHTSMYTGEQMDKGLQAFLLSIDEEGNDYGELFIPAKAKLGTLKYDEMYGFVPALILGGPATLEHLEKVKAVEHLIFLSQVSELEPYSMSDF